MNWKHITSINDVPKEPHFAIIEFKSITIPGDERSRKHPGHGYPESVERFTQYYAYTDEIEWLEDIKAHAKSGISSFFAIKVNPVSVKTETVITIK